jgi:hypothetical protein
MKFLKILILILIFGSCASKKSAELKEDSKYTFSKITERFDAKKLNYIGLKKYCVGGIQIEKPDKKECRNCYSDNDIYFLWNEKDRSYIQKFDNCSEFNIIEISNFQLNEYLKNNTSKLQNEKVGRFRVGEKTYSSISHSCFRNYIINDGQNKYANKFDIYDLTGENKNLNYQSNNQVKLVILDKKINEIISELEKENRF